MTREQILTAALEEVREMARFSMTRDIGLAGAGLWSKVNAALEAAAKVPDTVKDLVEMAEVVAAWLRLPSDPAPGASAGMAGTLQDAVDAYQRGVR